MADLFLKTTGSFSALTPQVVAASYFVPGNTSNAINTERYQTFTPTAGNCEGVFICLNLSVATPASYSVTVKLQEQTPGGGWAAPTDRATKTLTNEVLLGTNQTANGSFTWVYFEFASPYTITAVADTWRIAVSGSSVNYWWYNTATYLYAIVLTTGTTYSANDNILVKDGITVTMDQAVTCNYLVTGNESTWTWGTAPAASYELDCEAFEASRLTTLSAGTELLPISAANRAVIDITAFSLPAIYTQTTNAIVRLYGAKPTNIYSYLAANATSGQKNIVTTEDMTGLWNVGDTLVILGRKGSSAVGYRSDTIASISGTTITMTNNLTADHIGGFCVWNDTKKDSCGIYIQQFNSQGTTSTAVFKVSGARTDTTLYAGYYQIMSASSGVESVLLDTIIGTRTGNIGFNSTYLSAYSSGDTFQNIFSYSGSWNSAIYIVNKTNITVSHVYCGIGAVGGSGISVSGSIIAAFSNVHSSGGQTDYYAVAISATNYTCTGVKGYSYGGGALGLSGSGHTFTSSVFEGDGAKTIKLSGNTDAIFDSCTFSQNSSPTYDFSFSSSIKVEILVRDSTDFTINETEMAATVNSFVKADTYDETANDHRSWWGYGKMQSTGDGLADTTVHTSGSGKFALRYEPLSSTYNLDDWVQTIPTGNIQNKTMTVAVWCKINNAAYYAGTHQLPRLTINYDNGTTAYAQAAESTDWQQLFVTFTPTTTYGAITATLSGRTDATTTNAYIYWDDWSVLYPASVALDLGGMDNWADALPVSPTVAIPVSAYTVSNAVWEELLSSHTTASTFGKLVGSKLLTVAKFLGLK